MNFFYDGFNDTGLNECLAGFFLLVFGIYLWGKFSFDYKWATSSIKNDENSLDLSGIFDIIEADWALILKNESHENIDKTFIMQTYFWIRIKNLNGVSLGC